MQDKPEDTPEDRPGDTPRDTRWRALLRPAWLPALAVLLGGVLLHSMNVLMLATVLPSIVTDVGGAALMSWPTTAFLASSIMAASSTGYLSERVGARNAFAGGALVFGIGALVCALAPSMDHVIAGRFVQGFGGGTLSAMAFVLIRKTFPETLWVRAFSLLSATWSLSVLVGPMVGGLFALYGGWRGAFITVAVMAGSLAVVALWALPRAPGSGAAAPPVPFGRVGLIGGAIGAISLAAAVPMAAVKALLFILAIAVLAMMLRIDRANAAPLFPSDAFSMGSATGVGLWTALLICVAYSPPSIFVPILLQTLHGLDPLGAGYVVAGSSLGWTVAGIAVAGASERSAARLMVAGPLAVAIGLLGVGLFLPVGPVWALVAAIVLVGGGIGSCWGFIAERVMKGARSGEGDLAASSFATVQQVGFAFGAALAGLVANLAGFARGVEPGGIDRAAMLDAGFWVPVSFVVVALASAGMGARLRRLHGRSSGSQ